ncbi:Carbohydrate kinase PfkB [Gracilaria domingensis]|nr:Carbohydrate kinase PfkB [Gracilaria domingensis]
MPQLQGAALRELFERVRADAPHVLLTLDVNGADTTETPETPILLPALEYTAAIHANLDEACVITGLAAPSSSDTMPAHDIEPIVKWFVDNGAGVACITCGKDGVFIATRTEHKSEHKLSQHLEYGSYIYRGAYKVTEGAPVNASGAGDAFMAGVVAELSESTGKGGVARLADAGLVSALHRIDPMFCGQRAHINQLLSLAKNRDRIPARASMQPSEFAVE